MVVGAMMLFAVALASRDPDRTPERAANGEPRHIMTRSMALVSVSAAFVALTVTPTLRAQQPPAAPVQQTAPPAALKSPEIHPDRTVTFRLPAPKAKEVTLNGSWDNGTNLKMTKDEAGVWSTTIGPLAPQLWGYWFVVDGVKALDPNNGETQRDGARYDNLLMISGPESEWWDFKDVPHGTVQAVWYPSPTLKLASRRMMVYTPPGYETGTPEVSGAVPAARRRRRRGRVADDGPREHHHGQPDRRRQGEADDRRDAERQRDADGVAGVRLRSDAGAAVGDGAGAAAGAGGSRPARRAPARRAADAAARRSPTPARIPRASSRT